MAKSGGSSTIAGTDFELLFTAYQLGRLALGEIEYVKPQAEFISRPVAISLSQGLPSGETQLQSNSVDDVLVKTSTGSEYYNCKHQNTGAEQWNLPDLLKREVLKDLFVQWQGDRSAKVYFVTTGNVPFIHEVLEQRASGCETVEELRQVLSENQNKDWVKAVQALKVNEEEFLLFSRHIFLEQVNEGMLESNLCVRLANDTNDPQKALYALKDLAAKAAKKGKTVYASEVLEQIKQKGGGLVELIDAADLPSVLKEASASLELVRNNLETAGTIEHPTTNELVLATFPEQEPTSDNARFILLHGAKGVGKSALLKKCLAEAQHRQIPVLGIKTDQVEFSENRPDIPGMNRQDMVQVVKSVCKGSGRLILLLDQLDALSLSASSGSPDLKYYLQALIRLRDVTGLTVIVSCRTFDLEFDASLRDLTRLGKNLKKIEAGPFSTQQVQQVLSGQGFDLSKIAPDQLELLRLPIALDLFLRTNRPQEPYTRVGSLQDLYEAFWRELDQKIDPAIPWIKALKRVVDYCDQHHRLRTPAALLDSMSPARTRLSSENVFNQDGPTLALFHQSFFEYAYARFAFQNGTSIVETTKTSGQGLEFRGRLQNLLQYGRALSVEDYLNDLQALLDDPEIRFHIKLLALQDFCYRPDPSEQEKRFARKLLRMGASFNLLVRPLFQGAEWLAWLLESGLVTSGLRQKESRQQTQTILWRSMDAIPDLTIKYLTESLPEFEGQMEFQMRLFAQIRKWSSESHFEYFNSLWQQADDMQKLNAEVVVMRMCNDNPEFGLRILLPELRSRILQKKKLQRYGGHDSLLYELEKLIKERPLEVASDVLEFLEYVSAVCQNAEDQDRRMVHYDLYVTYARAHSTHPEYARLRKDLETALATLAEKQPEFINALASKHLSPDRPLSTEILLFAVHKSPERFPTILAEVASWPNCLEVFEDRYYVRNAIGTGLIVLNETERQLFLDRLSNYQSDHHNPKYRDLGRFRWLQSIPEQQIKTHERAWRLFQEGTRKFQNVENKPERHHWVGTVPSPLSTAKEELLTEEQWLNAFKKYPLEGEDIGWKMEPFSVIELGRQFARRVEKEPERFLPFVRSLGQDPTVDQGYFAFGIQGLVKSQISTSLLLPLILEFSNTPGRDLRLDILRFIKKLADEGALSEELLDIVIDFALNDPSPEEEDRAFLTSPDDPSEHSGSALLHSAVNSVRGTATEFLVLASQQSPFVEKILSACEQIATDSNPIVRAALLQHLFVLIRHDRSRTQQIFWKALGEQPTEPLVSVSLKTIRYLLNEETASELLPLLRFVYKMSESAIYHHSSGQLAGLLLILAWREGLDGAQELFEEFVTDSPEVIQGALWFVIDNLNEFPNNQNLKCFCMELFSRFAKSDAPELKHYFDRFWYHLEDFDDLGPVLEVYKTLLIKRPDLNSHAVIEALTANEYSRSKPEMAENKRYFSDFLATNEEHLIRLFSLFLDRKPDLEFNDDHLFKGLVALYQETKGPKREEVLDLLDSLIEQQPFSDAQNMVLNATLG